MGKVSCKNSLVSCFATDCMCEVFVASIVQMAIRLHSGLGKIDCNRYSLLFVYRMHWTVGAFTFLNEYRIWPFTFFWLKSIFDSFRRDYFIFSKFKMLNCRYMSFLFC